MPKRGDDLDAITAAVGLEHLANATVTITPKPYIAVHPDINKSVPVDVIAEQRYPEGTKIEAFVWTILAEKKVFDDAGIGVGAMVRMPDGKDKAIVEREPVESDDVVTMWVLQ